MATNLGSLHLANIPRLSNDDATKKKKQSEHEEVALDSNHLNYEHKGDKMQIKAEGAKEKDMLLDKKDSFDIKVNRIFVK